jgi:CRISPR/Cas system CSM-associated protein Csm5 (group 7 of RAMP superfamily)
MEENVSQELDALKGMLHNWKKGFLSWASPDGDNEHVLLEFTEEIQTNIYPYVRRLFETEHITESEAKEFMSYCFSQVEDLRQQLKEVDTDTGEKEV